MEPATLLTLQACLPKRMVFTLLAALDAWWSGAPADPVDLAAFLAEMEAMGRVAAVPSLREIEEAHNRALGVIAVSGKAGAALILTGDPVFPKRLLIIPDPPLLLYVKGEVSLLSEERAMAVIGTRRPSGYGLRAAGRVTAALVDHGYTIVSGLALGCDTAAHRACLDRGGRTVAVLPSGVDVPWPPRNRPLAEAILAKGGCIVSEYPPGEEPRRYTYVKRDRLQSGLSRGVVLIETDLQGGAMHTVRYARQQGRPVACVASHPPRFRQMPGFEGNAKLLRDGEAVGLAQRGDLERFIRRVEGR